ncbi:MAG: hypothetical protein AAFR70_15630, partial [Pseudomonadota bacterium]
LYRRSVVGSLGALRPSQWVERSITCASVLRRHHLAHLTRHLLSPLSKLFERARLVACSLPKVTLLQSAASRFHRVACAAELTRLLNAQIVHLLL